ncbi:unnamed protein product [Paramecium primaurelia]|uniref:Uncharacterized protein n=1 Tax=Paramecium primaurelia TaxID=5886 RepID=A0A8S1KC44_PARPR|nr:unnamed protein product [Paramecium primaurelia]
MFKIFRLIETLGRFFKKPPAGTGRRIAMSPFFKNILTEDEEENFKRQEIFYDPHTYYLRQQKIQSYQNELMQKNHQRRDESGLSELVITAKMPERNQLSHTGDYQIHNQDSFLHSIQLGRKGAENHFFSLDDVESIFSSFEQDINFDIEDSIVYQH